MSNDHSHSHGEGLISNILAVAGFIILIVIIIWGAFHFLNLASSGFSSLFSRSRTASIQLTAPKTMVSGEVAAISWKYTPSAAGSYAMKYDCRPDFEFKIQTSTSTASTIPCGTAYTVAGRDATSLRLIPTLASGASVDVPLTLMYMAAPQSGTSTPTTKSEARATITVNKGSATGTGNGTTGTVTPKPTTPTTPTTPKPTTPTTPVAPKPVGKPDLSVRIIAVGVIDANGVFVARTPTSPHEIAAVKFDIANVGAGPTGAWYFTASLPTSPATPYVSPAQKSLGVGDHIENTLRFNQMAQGGGLFTVSVDPSNAVSELNESNNYANQMVSGGYYYQQPYPYYQY